MRPPSMNSSRRFSISYRGRSQTVWRPVGQGLRKKLRRIWAAWSAHGRCGGRRSGQQRIPSGRRALTGGEFLLLFIVLMIIAHFLANLISKVFRLPLLRQADGLLGALLGAVEGVVLGLVAVTVMQMMAASTDRECAHFPTGYRKYRSRQCGCADQSGYRNA